MAATELNNAGATTKPSDQAEAITPNDSTDLNHFTRGIYVGVGGNIKVNLSGGSSGVVFVGAVAGSVIPIRASRVWAAGTTATNLVALY